MSDRDEKSGGAAYVSLPPELDAVATRLAAERFSSKAQVLRQCFGEWCREHGELGAEPERVAS